MTTPPIELGKTGIFVTPLGLGTWQWGDQMFWQYGQGYQEGDVRAAFDRSLEAGINFFDTAEVYGSGRSEKLLGAYAASVAGQADAPDLTLATKFALMPWRVFKVQLLQALRASLQRMGRAQVDLYQIHWPTGLVPLETWAEGLADAVQAGLTRAVGVSNYNTEQMRRTYLALKKRGVHLTSNQVHYSLLNRKAEKSGLLALCAELGITLIAYSPLEKGILTGKYTPERLPPGLRSRQYGAAYLKRVQPVIETLRRLGETHSKTPAQVALNWAMCKGTLVIPGAKNARQAAENAGALGWALTEAEMAELEQASDAALGVETDKKAPAAAAA